MASSSNHAMMATIDSLKGKMSDEVYLELCNKMKELHNQQEEPEEAKAYCIWFMVAKGRTIHLGEIFNGGRYDTDGFRYDINDIGRDTTELHNYDLFTKKHIVLMTPSEANEIKTKIDNDDSHCGDFSFNSETMAPFFKKYKIGNYERRVYDADDMSVKVYRIEAM